MTRQPNQVPDLWRSYISPVVKTSRNYKILRPHQNCSQMQVPEPIA